MINQRLYHVLSHSTSPYFSDADVRIRLLIADAPKRAEIRCIVASTAYFGCDLCEQKATNIVNPNPKKTGAKRAWPDFEDADVVNRTHDNLLDRAQSALAGLGASDNAGVKGRSPLFDLRGFDVVEAMPQEMMHAGAEGVVKDIVG